MPSFSTLVLPLSLTVACTRGPALDAGGAEAPGSVTGARVRFLALGDAGEGNIPQYRVGLAMADFCASKADDRGPGCDFVVYLGDNFYPGGVSGPDDDQWDTKWADPYRQLDLPFYAILGNHDYGDPPFDRDRARAELAGAAAIPGYHLPAPWYAFDAGPARFVALDSHAVMMGWTQAEQQAWATTTLDAAADRWRIALVHHPFKSNGQHGNAGQYEGSAWLPYASGGRVRSLYEDSLCGRVDLVLSGHEHNRQWLEPVCGMELVIAGSGAKNTRLVGRGNPTFFEEDRERGFVWVELDGDRMQAEVVDEWGRLDFVRERVRGQP